MTEARLRKEVNPSATSFILVYKITKGLLRTTMMMKKKTTITISSWFVALVTIFFLPSSWPQAADAFAPVSSATATNNDSGSRVAPPAAAAVVVATTSNLRLMMLPHKQQRQEHQKQRQQGQAAPEEEQRRRRRRQQRDDTTIAKKTSHGFSFNDWNGRLATIAAAEVVTKNIMIPTSKMLATCGLLFAIGFLSPAWGSSSCAGDFHPLFSPSPAFAAVTTTTATTTMNAADKNDDTTTPTTTPVVVYDGFAEYAKENKMEQSDVGCFITKCGPQTKALFANPRGIKGVSCLGRCKGEQACATQCFAEFGSETLNNWLSCTIEENECVKVPKKPSTIDNSAEETGYPHVVTNFDPSTLVGTTWYKTNGMNPNYDLFDCQTNRFTFSSSSENTNKNDNGPKELDMEIFLRVRRPEESGGGYWENALTEHMVVDNNDPSSQRTMHTQGSMYGLQFYENWYILGESDGKSGGIPPYKLVAYKGHTLQGNYQGAFVYAQTPTLPPAALPAIRADAAKNGLDFDTQFTAIDNTCPNAGNSLNDDSAGTGTSTTDWINLIIGQGGVIDWISPGWRGEYSK